MNDKICNIDICLTSDLNYIKYMATTMLSILKNSNDNENITFHLLISDSDLYDNEKQKILELKKIKDFQIKFYSPDLNKCQKFMEKSINKKWPLSAFYRLQIPYLIKDVDKLLYLDGDMIVNTNLSKLFDIDIKDNLAIVTNSLPDFALTEAKRKLNFNESDTYFCSGFMLLNNYILRRDNYEAKFIDALNNVDELYIADEDIFNIVFKNKVKYIENEWAYIVTKYFYNSPMPLDKIKIIHYGGHDVKPWKENFNGFYFIEWWKYFAQTEWFKEEPIKYLNMLINNNINNYYSEINKDINNLYTEINNLKNKLSFFDYIFSIREYDKYKIIRIFGIKITIKKDKKG